MENSLTEIPFLATYILHTQMSGDLLIRSRISSLDSSCRQYTMHRGMLSCHFSFYALYHMASHILHFETNIIRIIFYHSTKVSNRKEITQSDTEKFRRYTTLISKLFIFNKCTRINKHVLYYVTLHYTDNSNETVLKNNLKNIWNKNGNKSVIITSKILFLLCRNIYIILSKHMGYPVK